MEAPIAISMGLIVALLLLRRYAARRVLARDSRFVWLMFPVPVIAGAALLWVSVGLFAKAPIAALAIAAVALLLIGILMAFFIRAGRAIKEADPGTDVPSALMAPLADVMTALVGLMLFIGVAGGVALVLLAILNRS
jgi:energy-converting hydrogenase Eha subunit A